MAALEKNSDEWRDRATRMVVEACREPDSKAGALARAAQQLGMNPEALRNRGEEAENARSYRYGHPRTVL